MIDPTLIAKFVNAASGLLKMIRFDGKGPGPPLVRALRTATFKDYFGGKMAFALTEILEAAEANPQKTREAAAVLLQSHLAEAAGGTNAAEEQDQGWTAVVAELKRASVHSPENADPDNPQPEQESRVSMRSQSYMESVVGEGATNLDQGSAVDTAAPGGDLAKPTTVDTVEVVVQSVKAKLLALLAQEKTKFVAGIGGSNVFAMAEQVLCPSHVHPNNCV
jgi:hypothetical protein